MEDVQRFPTVMLLCCVGFGHAGHGSWMVRAPRTHAATQTAAACGMFVATGEFRLSTWFTRWSFAVAPEGRSLGGIDGFH